MADRTAGNLRPGAAPYLYASAGPKGIAVPDKPSVHGKESILSNLQRPGRPDAAVAVHAFGIIRVVVVLKDSPRFHYIGALHINKRAVPYLAGVVEIPVQHRAAVKDNIPCGKAAAAYPHKDVPGIPAIVFTGKLLPPANGCRVSCVSTRQGNVVGNNLKRL